MARIVTVDSRNKRLLDSRDPSHQVLQVGFVNDCFLYHLSVQLDGDE